jgi:hypothetical protein
MKQRKDLHGESTSQIMSINIFAEQIGNRLKDHAASLSRVHIRRAAAAARLTAVAAGARNRRAEDSDNRLSRVPSDESTDLHEKRPKRSSVGTVRGLNHQTGSLKPKAST